MNAARIVVVGSYATGLTMKVPRIPCAGETLLGAGYRVDFGGKGSNQAVGCARLGAQVSFVAKVGQDSFSDMAFQLYRDEDIDVSKLKKTSDAPTGVGFIVVDDKTGQNLIVLDPGANELLSAAEVAEAESTFRAASVVLTQLEIPVAAAQAALACGRSAGAITILNPAPVRQLTAATLASVDILTPNETEAKVLTGRAPDCSIEPQLLGRELINSGVKQVVMTLGENGALLISASSCQHFPAISVSAVDTTGAGDAFNAGLATALAHGASLEEAVNFAIVTGAMAVTKEGVIPSLPNQDEVLAFLQQNKMPTPPWLAAYS